VLLGQARQHLASAMGLTEFDPSLAYVALYDAARKAVAAHMLAHGFRERVGSGAHQAIVDYAQAGLVNPESALTLARFDRLRRNRNRSEYESWSQPGPMRAWLPFIILERGIEPLPPSAKGPCDLHHWH
jgi:hypothetical protein